MQARDENDVAKMAKLPSRKTEREKIVDQAQTINSIKSPTNRKHPANQNQKPTDPKPLQIVVGEPIIDVEMRICP